MSDELIVEHITFEQFKQVMAGEEVRGIATGEMAYAVEKQEPVIGQDLATHRVRVSFDFDVTCNDASIHSAGNDDETTTYDLALLRSFLVADEERLLHLLVDACAIQLGLNSVESLIAAYLPQLKTESHHLFRKAIDELSGDEYIHWRDVEEDDYQLWGETVMQLATEQIFECFSAQFVKSSFKIVEEEQT